MDKTELVGLAVVLSAILGFIAKWLFGKLMGSIDKGDFEKLEKRVEDNEKRIAINDVEHASIRREVVAGFSRMDEKFGDVRDAIKQLEERGEKILQILAKHSFTKDTNCIRSGLDIK